MSSILEGYSDHDWGKVRRILAPALRRHGPGAALVAESITLLEQATAHNPAEWGYWYALCDYYQRSDNWEAAVEAGQHSYTLRPNDPRSAYALATAYRFWAWNATGTGPDIENRAWQALTLFLQVCNAPLPEDEWNLVKRHIVAMLVKYPKLAQRLPAPPSHLQYPATAGWPAWKTATVLVLLLLLIAAAVLLLESP